MSKYYDIALIPCSGGPGKLLQSVSVTDSWQVAVEIAKYYCQQYPLDATEYQVEIGAAADVHVYARWHVLQDSAGARTVCGGFLDGADRERASAQ